MKAAGYINRGLLGGHTISGAVLEPRALNELLPDWQQDETCPLKTPVTKDEMFLLTKSLAIPLPIPPSLHNPSSNFIVSLSEFVRWLGGKAEEAGVEIYPGFAGSELVYNEDRVVGVATNDVGLNRSGQPKVKRYGYVRCEMYVLMFSLHLSIFI